MATVSRDDVLTFLRRQLLAVEASVSDAGMPQAAVVGVVVIDELEVFFDTMASSRKAANLRLNPRIALVIGRTTRGDERTVHYEGVADTPVGDDLDSMKELYFHR